MLKAFFKNNSRNLVFKILADFGKNINKIYENRNHNIDSNGELNVIKKIAKTNPKVLFDGGANIGKYSVILEKHVPKAAIYAFEPVKSTFELFQKNAANYQNIKPINKGLYKENCIQKINIYDSNTHSSLYEIKGVHYSPNTTTEIQLTVGDEFMKENNIEVIDFLKLDLEGAEYDALLGFENSLKNQAIKVIQFEYGYINISSKKLLIDFYELLEKYNYLVGKIYPKHVEFRAYKFKHEDFIGPNFIAVSKSENKLIKLLQK